MLEGMLQYVDGVKSSGMIEDVNGFTQQLAACLEREKQNRQDMETLEKQLTQHLEDVYATMKSIPYKLVGVWMHSGSASGGHFWAYIKDFKTEKFMKFNDIFVSEVC